jgi:hypothetical protein
MSFSGHGLNNWGWAPSYSTIYKFDLANSLPFGFDRGKPRTLTIAKNHGFMSRKAKHHDEIASIGANNRDRR